MTVVPETLDGSEFAGHAAAEVEKNWSNPEYRTLLMMALGQYLENMIVFHQDEWKKMYGEAAKQTADKARRAVVKAYLTQAIGTVSKNTTDAKGHEHDTRGLFTGPGGNRSTRRVHDSGEGPLDLDQAARIGRTINAYAHYDPEFRNQQMHYTIEDREGNQRSFVSHDGRVPNLQRGEKVVSYKPLGIAQANTIGGHAFNLVQTLGADPRTAAALGGAATALRTMTSDKNVGDHYAKVAAGAQLLGQLGAAGVVPHPAVAAAAVGLYAAKHGPEVAQVLGPHMRRIHYKYRGMEATPQQKSSVAQNGIQEGETPEAFEMRLIHALASTDKGKGGLSAVPTKEANALMLKTGNTAPSVGFIVDKHSKVHQQAVGVSDDHYVPFNLKHLHSLHGGSFVRSRAYGGPTTEDMQLAMRTGAKRVWIVSRNGAFKVEFEQRADGFRGKYGDLPHTVTKRYARLLDGIQHGTLTDPVTSQALKLNGHGYDVALQSLKQQFPLLIKDVQFIKPSDIPALGQNKEAEHGEEDSGYIRPMYLKPSGARHGFYDPLLKDPKNPGGSFDDLKAYRSRKATLLRLRQAEVAAKAEAERRAWENRPKPVVTFGQGNRDANQAGVKDGQSPRPSNLSVVQGQVADAGGGTSSSETVQRAQRVTVSPGHVGDLLAFGRAVVDNAPPNDAEARHFQAVLGADSNPDAKPEHVRALEELEEALTHNPGERQAFLNTMADIHGANRTGLELPMPSAEEAGEEPPEYGSDDPVEEVENSQDGRTYAKLKRYEQLAQNLSDHRKVKGQDAELSPDKMKELGDLHTLFQSPDQDDAWDDNNRPTLHRAWTQIQYPNLGGLTYREHHENRLDAAMGKKERHALRETPDTGVEEDDSPEEKERKASEYAEKEMRDLYHRHGDDDDVEPDYFGDPPS